ncbi:two pore domain potassium channel family protein [Parahaliea maris]|uniref:Two pore domain potassium channel family protein n=1 Tax=Parahaliea maris TaxID=2716870 RepID=A0A5C8ZR16_9GAMM|nr:ion channel [Parahaliea maris]TXS90179.1 two pore domain potassium channel family protein [Parahaliea maris]
MLINVLLGMTTMAVCLILQGLLVVWALRYYSRRRNHMPSAFLAAMRVVTGLMLILIIGNVVQISVWALLFYSLGEFDSLGLSIYHSAVNFATLGYGDIVMSEQHRLLGPLEAVHGALMIGVSTAALSRAFGEAMKVHGDASTSDRQ